MARRSEKGKGKLIAGVALFVLSLSLSAQDQSSKPFQAEVNFVRVDMYPTRDGKPVTDLRAEEIELLEDGVPQTIAQFEHVSISGPRPQTLRREPSTVDEMRRAARDPRARVFVLFLDPRHVGLLSSMQARAPLINALNQLVGGDDLIAVMTPDASPSSITFSRRTNNIEEMLSKYWGAREWMGTRDSTELQYEACYPPDPTVRLADIAQRMIDRRREVLVLDALDGLVQHLRGLREERKAVITVSDGWPLYGPDRTLALPIADPTGGQVHTQPIPTLERDPRTGRPGPVDTGSVSISSDNGVEYVDRLKCENDRLALAELRNEPRFVNIMQGANRANVSFYPIDPGRLFSGAHSLRTNHALEMMASITDGMLMHSADALESGLRRVVEDLSSYYLLGYNSPAGSDGKFHDITVRIKRPGVLVRARAGFFAARVVEPEKPLASASSVDASESALVTLALSPLAGFTRDLPLRVRAASAWTPAGRLVIRAVAEVTSSRAMGDDWSKGGDVDVTFADTGGDTIATQRASIAAGFFVAPVTIAAPAGIEPGDYRLQFRAKGVSALGSSEALTLSIEAAPVGTGTMFLRRFGRREVPTAESRFRRTERIIIETPATPATDISARLLDRTGKPLKVPVTASIREAEDGTRWRRVEVTLAPLGIGEYIVEQTSGTDRTLTAFRVVP